MDLSILWGFNEDEMVRVLMLKATPTRILHMDCGAPLTSFSLQRKLSFRLPTSPSVYIQSSVLLALK